VGEVVLQNPTGKNYPKVTSDQLGTARKARPKADQWRSRPWNTAATLGVAEFALSATVAQAPSFFNAIRLAKEAVDNQVLGQIQSPKSRVKDQLCNSEVRGQE